MAAKLGKGYSDLNIPWTNESNVVKIIEKAVELGYETVAINVQVHQRDLVNKTQVQKKKGNKKAKLEEKEDPSDQQQLVDFPDPPSLKISNCRILTRLTLTFENNNFLPIFNNSNAVKSYDLLAVSPESSLALQNILKSSSFKADLIAFPSSFYNDLKWTRKLYEECVEKFMYFELLYSPAIRDSSERRRIITTSHHYRSVGKSKHILISSGALRPIEVRSPHDVANLGFLFGLTENQGKDAVKRFPLEAIKSGAGRKIGPYRAVVQKIDEDIDEEDRWKIPSTSSSSDEDE